MKATNPDILLTGATGNIGSLLAKKLSDMGVAFRAMVRKPEEAEELRNLPGATLVTGDFNDTDAVKNALQGIKKAFLLTNSTERTEQQQAGFVDAAVAAGVQHIVKLSQLKADRLSPVRFLRYHAAIEERIKATGIGYTFLRPNLFMQGFLLFKDVIRYQGKFFAPAGEAKVSVVDIRDIAAVAAQALTSGGLQQRVLDLTGPEALTHAEIAEQLSAALGRKIEYIDAQPSDMLQALLSFGMPAWQAEGLIEDYAHYARGEAAAVSNDIADVTGAKARSFAEFSSDYAPFF
jgi:uncharacterized protein YbjT (DUF2867 family)